MEPFCNTNLIIKISKIINELELSNSNQYWIQNYMITLEREKNKCDLLKIMNNTTKHQIYNIIKKVKKNITT